LRDTNARRQLLQEPDLSWDNLNTKLKAKKLARDSDLLLNKARAIVDVKQEVGAVSSLKQTKNSSSDTCDSCSVNRVSRSKIKRRPYLRSSLRNSDHYRSRRTSRSSNSSGDDSKRHYNSRDKLSSSQRSKRDEKPFVDRLNPGYYCSRSNRFSSPRREGNLCYHCKKHDHRIRDCADVRCFVCNCRGHTTKDCPERETKPYRSSSGISDRNKGYRRVRFAS